MFRRPGLGPIVPIRADEWWHKPGVDGNTIVSENTNLPSTTDGDIVHRDYSSLVIDAGKTLTVENRCKGLAILVRGDCIINGTLSMTKRGAYQTAMPLNDVFINKGTPLVWPPAVISPSSTPEYCSLRVGAAGGNGSKYTGSPGATGGIGQTGGGGGGAGTGNDGVGGNGSPGYAFGGGSGGGGASYSYNGANAAAYGGPGGAGDDARGGGGAGNPGGTGSQSGEAGTGGVLILVVGGDLTISGTISANGANGGAGGPTNGGGGGGSGGGRIIILYRGEYLNTGSITANGGAGGTGYKYSGGAGGAGSISVVQI